ncbi:unnamed protein product [Closterium sp. NIES-65]|nr:unnamed protein product [Closterium sp. NIES-65]
MPVLFLHPPSPPPFPSVLAEAAGKTRSQATTGEARGKGARAKAGEARDKAVPTNKRAGQLRLKRGTAAGGGGGGGGGGMHKVGGGAGGWRGGRGGSVIGVVGARMSGEQMVGSAGMANATGRLELKLVKTATDMDVHYSLSLAHLSSPSPPTAASIHAGRAASASALLLLAFPASAWTNTTRPFHRASNATAAAPPAAARFSYGARGVWGNASSLSAAAGGSVAAAVSTILAAPASFHALIATSAFPQGAVRGQMANMTRGGK